MNSLHINPVSAKTIPGYCPSQDVVQDYYAENTFSEETPASLLSIDGNKRSFKVIEFTAQPNDVPHPGSDVIAIIPPENYKGERVCFFGITLPPLTSKNPRRITLGLMALEE